MKGLLPAIAAALFLACAATVTRFEQYSPAMTLAVEPDSTVVIGRDDQFTGVLWLNPILAAEKTPVTQVKLIENYGVYFVAAEGFRRIWMIEPKGDGMSAVYRSVDVTPKDETDVYERISLSRYGTSDNACVRVRLGRREAFVDKKGRVYEKWAD